MKIRLTVLLLLSLTSGRGEPERVPWHALGDGVEIIGQLGVPLGTEVLIEATVVTGEEATHKVGDIRLGMMRFLRVESVDGIPLDEPALMHFSVAADPLRHVDPVDTEEARRHDALIRSRSPHEAPLGTRFTLLAYESGYTPPNPREGPNSRVDAGVPFVALLPDPTGRRSAYFRPRLAVVIPSDTDVIP